MGSPVSLHSKIQGFATLTTWCWTTPNTSEAQVSSSVSFLSLFWRYYQIYATRPSAAQWLSYFFTSNMTSRNTRRRLHLFRQSQSRQNRHAWFQVHAPWVHVGWTVERQQVARLVFLTLLALFPGFARFSIPQGYVICRPSGTDKKRMEELLLLVVLSPLSPLHWYRIHLRRPSWFLLHCCPLSLARQKHPLLRRKHILHYPFPILSPFFPPQSP